MRPVAEEDRHVLPTSVQVRRNRWIWAICVPWLPDLLADHGRLSPDPEAPEEVESAYIAMMQGLVSGPSSSALQVRLLSRGHGLVHLYVLGRARTEQNAQTLARLVVSTLPVHLPVELVAPDGLASLLDAVPPRAVTWENVAEIRRRPETADPLADVNAFGSGSGAPTVPVLMPWTPGPHSLRTAVAIMRALPAATVLCLHAERTAPTADVLTHLEVTVRELVGVEDPANPLARDIALAYIERLRTWPRGVLTMRVLLVSAATLPSGLAESVALDLTRGAFDVVSPSTPEELVLALELAEFLEERSWGEPDDPDMAVMIHLVSPAEAATVVRFPTPPPGGMPGVATMRVSMLPRSPQPAATERRDTVHIGSSPFGGSVDLSLTELNQHLLVAGLPGFGKTTTVQSLLLRLAQEHGVPFLVIDPAKSDYEALTSTLVRGRPVRRVVLDAQHPAFNPFAVPEGATASSHAGRVLAAFDAALMISSAWQFGFITLGRGLFAAYERAEQEEAPTLRSVYAALGDVIRRSRFAAEAASNARAALLDRIEFLVRGPLGIALAAGPSGGIDWADLLSEPTVVELRSFAGPTERSLVFALLIAGLLTYREAHPTAGGLAHVTVLEEAHRVLGAGAAADGEGARLLIEGIAELRGSGEGFVIVDQAPTTLHASVVKLTGSVLTHRVVERSEREALGSSLLLDERQSEDLARLAQGRAVFYGAQRQSSVVVDVAAVPRGTHAPAAAYRSLTRDIRIDPLFCLGCRAMCLHVERGRLVAQQLDLASEPADIATLALAAAPHGPGDLSRCIGVHVLAATASDISPASLFRRIDEFDRQLNKGLAARAAVRQGSST